VQKEFIERYNEWWFSGKIRKELALPFKRYAFPKILESLKERQILIITGLRRVGKTTLLYQVIEKLLENGADPTKILYFSFEESLNDPKEVLSFYEKYVLKKSFEEVGKIYIFFDEIQYARNWYSTVKQYYDIYPNLKFFISGSSSLLISKKALDHLAGRFFFLKLSPLYFSEFLEMKGIKMKDVEVFSRKYEIYFLDYLRKAGFPEIVDWENEVKISEYIKNSVIDRVILKDLPIIFKTKDIILLEKITKFILSNAGAIINLNSLSRDIGSNKVTVSNYLKYLETSLLIRSLSNYRISFLSESRKLRKYYPSTTSLIFANSKEVFERNFGAVLETYVVNTLETSHYFRKGNKEIDVIIKNDGILPVEVKEKVSEEDLRKITKIINYIGVKSCKIFTLNQSFKKENIEVIPIYLLESSFKDKIFN